MKPEATVRVGDLSHIDHGGPTNVFTLWTNSYRNDAPFDRDRDVMGHLRNHDWLVVLDTVYINDSEWACIKVLTRLGVGWIATHWVKVPSVSEGKRR